MTTVVRILQWITGIVGLGALVLGLMFWIANIDLISLHMLFGLIVALGLLMMSLVAVSTKGMRLLGFIGVLYAFILPIFGLSQATLLVGDLHWLIETAHMLVGIGAFALTGIMGTRYLRLTQAARATSQVTASEIGR